MLDKFFDWVKVGRFNAFPVDIVCNVIAFMAPGNLPRGIALTRRSC